MLLSLSFGMFSTNNSFSCLSRPGQSRNDLKDTLDSNKGKVEDANEGNKTPDIDNTGEPRGRTELCDASQTRVASKFDNTSENNSTSEIVKATKSRDRRVF